MAKDVEIRFVDESDFIKQENRYFWSKTSEWELDSTISLDSNDSLAGMSDFGEEFESAGSISSHDDTSSDSDTDSYYVLEPSTLAGSRRRKKSTNDKQKREESSVAKISLPLTTSDRGWTLSGRLGE